MYRASVRSAVSLALVGAWAGGMDSPASAGEDLEWAAGDPHVHTTAWGCDIGRDPEEIVEFLDLFGLDVASSLVWGAGYERDRPWFTGLDHPASRPGRVLHYDLEVSALPGDLGGHLILLGLRDLALFDAGSPHASGVPVIDWALAQDPRVTIGMAHAFKWPADGGYPYLDSWGRPLELPVHVALETLHFLSTEIPAEATVVDPGTWKIWRALLNSGFRLPLLGSSDLPCVQHTLGGAVLRTHALVEAPLTYESWLAALRAGRTALASGAGESLNLEIDGGRLGSEIRTTRGASIPLRIEANIEHAATVAVLANGEVAAELPVPEGFSQLETQLAFGESAWVVARSPRALTSPIYVLVDDAPIRASPEDACYLIGYVEFLSAHVRDGGIEMGADRDSALAAYAEARGVFEARFREAGGESCPIDG